MFDFLYMVVLTIIVLAMTLLGVIYRLVHKIIYMVFVIPVMISWVLVTHKK